MSDDEKKITVLEVGADGAVVDKSGPPLIQKKVRATDWLTPEELEKLIREKQKPEVG